MSTRYTLNPGDAPIQITSGSQSAFVTITEGQEFQMKHSATQPATTADAHTIRARDIERINTLSITSPFQMWVWVNVPNTKVTIVVSAG
ncbi:hypothetical protein [Acinetobacter soli]|uniref:hypothetical protein n=1 Tax=Acinetobacter soli TaxID=487316 RepID=UPI00125086D0|nr:hypothetical protein [Acinetobacter soli]